jgi:hypothetical protein
MINQLSWKPGASGMATFSPLHVPKNDVWVVSMQKTIEDPGEVNPSIFTLNTGNIQPKDWNSL